MLDYFLLMSTDGDRTRFSNLEEPSENYANRLTE